MLSSTIEFCLSYTHFFSLLTYYMAYGANEARQAIVLKLQREIQTEETLADQLSCNLARYTEETHAVLRIRVIRQKEEAQEEKTKPGHCVKRDTFPRRPQAYLQAQAMKKDKPTLEEAPERCYRFTKLCPGDKYVFTRLGERKRGVDSQLGPKDAPRHRRAIRKGSTSSKHQQEIEEEWNTADRASRRPYTRTKELYYSENDHDQGGHWKSKKPPSIVKTYDGIGDADDHLKIFQAAEKIERWAMPTWCHMFNSTLIGSARVWFDKLPSESIDNYEMLRKAFLGNYRQQKKYIKDPVEIHHIKQMEGESTEAFMERFKAESMHVSGAPECMRISGFMHGITNPDLIKKLNDNIPKSVDEMMSVTTAFLRGEVAAASQLKKKAPPAWKHHETGHIPNFDKRLDLKIQHKSNRRQDRFTPLIKTPKEIVAIDTVKFKAPPPMTGLAENQNKNKFCEFHGDKGHITNECIHLRRQIE
ncbi:reverse transcriptase domain-containing protein [Tanacetum coccineum]